MQNHFFAYLARMKYINRWSLMRSTLQENVQEHSLQVAMVAHALAVIRNKHFNGDLNPERAATLAIFHDVSEVITGDLPTPVKYFNSDIKEAYKTIEAHATTKLLALLPEDLKPDYEPLLNPTDKEHEAVVKAADSICAFIKCLEEQVAGNPEFNQARKTIEEKLRQMDQPEVKYFLDNFVESFSLTLDEISSPL